MKKIAIIGGGAAGLAAASAVGLFWRNCFESKGEKPAVTVFEASERVGRPILASGNGRCNFSNSHIDAGLYHNSGFARATLAEFERFMSGEGFQHFAPAELQRTNVSGETFSVFGEDATLSQSEPNNTALPQSRPNNATLPQSELNDAAFLQSELNDATLSQSSPNNAALPQSGPNGVVRFLERLGLLWREEGEGRLYPKANKASSVLDVLRAAVAETGAEVRTEARVERVELPRSPEGEAAAGRQFTLRMADGAFERADAVIVACGGAAAREMLPDSFDFIPQRPVLGPIATDARWVKQLDNIRVKCAIELLRADASAEFREKDQGAEFREKDQGAESRNLGELSELRDFGEHGELSELRDLGDRGELSEAAKSDEPREKRELSGLRRRDEDQGFRIVSRETGEVLFRKYGVSGIAAFNLSRLAQEGDTLAIDLFLETGAGALQDAFAQRLRMLKQVFGEGLTCGDFLRGAAVPQVAHVLCEYAGLDESEPCTLQHAAALARACKSIRLEYHGVGDAKQCQVQRGGFAPVGNFSAETLEAADAPGLFVVGEALDVDGPCGGYNLHWAFATGVLAGAKAAACE